MNTFAILVKATPPNNKWLQHLWKALHNELVFDIYLFSSWKQPFKSREISKSSSTFKLIRVFLQKQLYFKEKMVISTVLNLFNYYHWINYLHMINHHHKVSHHHQDHHFLPVLIELAVSVLRLAHKGNLGGETIIRSSPSNHQDHMSHNHNHDRLSHLATSCFCCVALALSRVTRAA